MPNNAVGVGGPRQVPLNTDFQHEKLGVFGRRSVQVGNAGQPRVSMNEKARTDFRSKVTRFLDSITPDGVRASGKFRRGLEDFSFKLGGTFGALLRGPELGMDLPAFERGLARLPDSSMPVITRGHDFPDVMSTRASIELKKLSDGELGLLRQRINSDEVTQLNGHLSEDSRIVLGQMREAVTAETARRARQVVDNPDRIGLVGKLKEAYGLSNRPTEFQAKIDQALGQARQILETGGYATDETAQWGLLNEAFGQLKEEINGLTQALSSAQLKSLLDGESPIETPATLTLQNMPVRAFDITGNKVLQEGSRRAEDYEQTINTSMQRLLDTPTQPMSDETMRSVVNDVSKLSTTFAQWREHAELFNIRPGDMVERVVQLKARLEDLLKPENLNLNALSDAELASLSKACTELTVEAPMQAISHAGPERITEARNSVKSQLTELGKSYQDVNVLGTGATTRELNDILDVGANLSAKFDKLVNAERLFGNTEMTPEQVTELRSNIITTVANEMPREQAVALVNAMNTTELGRIRALLAKTGDELPFPKLAGELSAAGRDAQLLDSALRARLTQEGVQVPASVRVNASLEQMPKSILNVLRERHNIVVSRDEHSPRETSRVTSGLAPESMQRELYLGASLQEDTAIREQQFQGVGLGISQQLYKDFTRATYIAEGQDAPFLDKEQLAVLGRSVPGETPEEATIREQQRDALIMSSLNQLKRFCGGNDEFFRFVSTYVHQGALEPIVRGELRGTLPLTLQDGTQGVPMDGARSTVYQLSRGDDGSIVVNVTYDAKNVSMVSDIGNGGLPKQVIPEVSSVKYHFAMKLTPDKRMEITEPLTFENNLVQDEGVNFLSHPQSAKFQEVHEFSKTIFADELFEFLVASHEYAQLENPTVGDARRIIDDFVRERVNFPDDHDHVRGELIEAFNNLGLDDNAPAPRDLFDPAQGPIQQLIRNGVLPQFLNRGRVN